MRISDDAGGAEGFAWRTTAPLSRLPWTSSVVGEQRPIAPGEQGFFFRKLTCLANQSVYAMHMNKTFGKRRRKTGSS